MDFTKLFEAQKLLDERIIGEHELEGQDLLEDKLLALRTEVGECANEWRGFKFWSEDQEARVFLEKTCPTCQDYGRIENVMYPIGTDKAEIDCPKCLGEGQLKSNPLLEEYVDGLHFILSIGIEIVMSKDVIRGNVNEHLSVTSAFNRVYNLISIMEVCLLSGNQLGAKIQYSLLINEYLNLGKLLHFDLDEVESAYFNKNAVNHERQADGY